MLTTIITSLPPLTKNPSSNNSCTLHFKSECPFRYKKAIIHNLISRAKLISSSKTIFYKEVENIKQALINNGFLTILLMNKLNVLSKMLTNKMNSVLLHPANKHISNFFIVTKCTTITNPMKKSWKHWFTKTYSPLILIKK